MTLRDLLKENEQSHWDAMNQTGFWGRQAAGCVFVAKDTGRFCISHRSAAVNEPNTWGTWGGAIDEGEDPAQAVRREIEEETGYSGALKLLPMLVFQAPGGSFRYYNFLAVVETEFEPELNWETQDYRWVDFGDWPKPQHPGLKSLLADAKSLALMKKFADNKSTDAEPVTELMRMGNHDDGNKFLRPNVERPILSMLNSDDPLKFQLTDPANITVFYLPGSVGSTSRAVVQNSDGRIVVSIAMSEQRVKNKRMLIIWSTWVSPLLRGQNLAAKIYKLLSEQLDAIIVSDDVHSTSGEMIWSKGLPKLDIHPEPFDLEEESVTDVDPYSDPNIRLAFKSGVRNLHQYLKSSENPHKQFFEPMDVTEDFTQRAKPGSRPGSLKRKAGKGKGEKITASDIKRLKSRANRMKQSDNAETRKRGIQLARQVSWYENFH